MMVLAGCGDGGSDPGDDVQAVAAEAEADAGTDTDADREEEDADPGAGSGDDNQPDDAGDDADASGEEAGDAAAAAVMALADRQVEGTVMLNGFEITVRDLTATDLDLEASPDGEVDRRSMGIELLFDVDVFNPTSGPGAPGSPVSMRWDEPDTGNVYDVRADLEVRDVPSNNSGSGQLVVVVPPDGLERFDEASTRLVFGPDGSATARLPVGDQPELVTRLPMEPALDEQLTLGDVDVTLTSAVVLFHNQQNQHVPEGMALLELSYDLDNQGGNQSCSTRGSGAWSLTLPTGNAVVDLGVSERCVVAGQSEVQVLTGFEIDEDYAGTYTLVHERHAMGEDFTDEVTFTLEEVEGLPAHERG